MLSLDLLVMQLGSLHNLNINVGTFICIIEFPSIFDITNLLTKENEIIKKSQFIAGFVKLMRHKTIKKKKKRSVDSSQQTLNCVEHNTHACYGRYCGASMIKLLAEIS